MFDHRLAIRINPHGDLVTQDVVLDPPVRKPRRQEGDDEDTEGRQPARHTHGRITRTSHAWGQVTEVLEFVGQGETPCPSALSPRLRTPQIADLPWTPRACSRRALSSGQSNSRAVSNPQRPNGRSRADFFSSLATRATHSRDFKVHQRLRAFCAQLFHNGEASAERPTQK